MFRYAEKWRGISGLVAVILCLYQGFWIQGQSSMYCHTKSEGNWVLYGKIRLSEWQLTGNLARFEARAIIMSAKIGQFAPVNLAFAWSENENVPVILGQVNFFSEFDVCFFASEGIIEIARKIKK